MSEVRDLPRELSLALAKCTPTQRRWLRALQKNGFRSWHAAKSIGASEASATRWRRKPHIQRVLALLDEMAFTDFDVSQAFLIAQHSSIAGSNLKDLYDESGQAIPIERLPDRVASALAERTIDTSGRVKYKFHPKQPSLEALQNLRGLGAKHRIEVTGKDGAPLMPEVSTDEVARRLLFLLEKGAAQATPPTT